MDFGGLWRVCAAFVAEPEDTNWAPLEGVSGKVASKLYTTGKRSISKRKEDDSLSGLVFTN